MVPSEVPLPSYRVGAAPHRGGRSGWVSGDLGVEAFNKDIGFPGDEVTGLEVNAGYLPKHRTSRKTNLELLTVAKLPLPKALPLLSSDGNSASRSHWWGRSECPHHRLLLYCPTIHGPY